MANPRAHASRRATDSPLADARAQHVEAPEAAEPRAAAEKCAEPRAAAEKCAELWVAQNHQAFECWNAYVDKNGLPLAAYRSF